MKNSSQQLLDKRRRKKFQKPNPFNPNINIISAPLDVQMSIPQRIFRTGGRVKRPVDKAIINVTKAAVAGSQVSTTLFTTTFPCTIVGLRWTITFMQDAGTGGTFINWAIIILRDGQTADTLATSDGSTLYNPEQDVMTFGVIQIDNNTETKDNTGETKTMRKMQGGDKLEFIAIGVATNTVTIRGTIQFFCKT